MQLLFGAQKYLKGQTHRFSFSNTEVKFKKIHSLLLWQLFDIFLLILLIRFHHITDTLSETDYNQGNTKHVSLPHTGNTPYGIKLYLQ